MQSILQISNKPLKNTKGVKQGLVKFAGKGPTKNYAQVINCSIVN